MKPIDKFVSFAAAAIVIASCLHGCTLQNPPSETEPSNSTPATERNFRASDLEIGYDETAATRITCLGTSAQVSGSGAEVEAGTVTITQAGVYILSGTLTGQVRVHAKDQEVQLVLDNLSVTSPDGPALWVEKAGKVIVLLAEDTVNTLTDSETYTLAAGETEPNACLFSKADLTINGEGELAVTGNYNHGIYCKDTLAITGGVFRIAAVNDGVKGKDGIKILTADMSIEAGGDGMQSNQDADASLGYISISDGSFTIHAGQDGIQAETALDISGGAFTVTTGGGSANAAPREQDSFQRPRDFRQNDTAPTETSDETTESAKGLKAGTALRISGGSFQLDSSDDAVHSNGTLTVSGGDFTIATGDDGFHGDGALSVSGGNIRITASYEGLEGLSVTISGGTISLISSDDGLNAAGGTDGSGGFRGDFFAPGNDSDCFIRIIGGTLEVQAEGDGIDSNGNLYIDGGTVYVNGPTSSADGALDYENTAEITGGTVIAVSSMGMTEGFTSGSTQCSFTTAFSSVVASYTELTVIDSNGNVICSYTPTKDYQSVVVSAPGLVQGETYTVTAGEQSVEVTLTSVATNSGRMGGPGGNEWPEGGFGGKGGAGMVPPDGSELPDGAQPGGREQPPDFGEPPALPADPDTGAGGI